MIQKTRKILYFSLAITLVIITMGSCDRELDTPPLKTLDPTLVPNTTIDQLLSMYKTTGQAFMSITEDKIIEATVIANDKSGNFYRQIIISDQTGGIEVKINDNNLHERYALGQKLYIRTKDLILGSYGGLVQLGGSIYESSGLRLGGIEPANVKGHLFRIPGGVLPQATPITLGGNMDAHLYTMVSLSGVQFTDAALTNPFSIPNQTTNRNLTDCNGNTIIVRTSSFADFAPTMLPQGNGTIQAILTKFVNDYQLIINDISDVNLNSTRCEVAGSPKGSGTFASPFNVAAAYNSNTGIAMWVQGYIVGVRETDVDPFVNNFSGPFRTNSNIILADTPDETNATRILMIQLPAGNLRAAVNLVNNPANKGKQVKLRGNLTAYFGFPGMRETVQYWMEGMPDPDPDPLPVIILFEEAFATNLGTFTDHNIIGEQRWSRVTYDGGAASINGFVSGSSKANENWLISPAIPLAGKTNPKMEIREAINYLTSLNDVKVLISTNYNGANPTSSGDWVHITAFTRPPGSNWTFVDSGPIDLSQFNNQTIHIAFRYTSSTSAASAWQISRVKVIADQ
jgi:hypothetical protein